MFPLFRAAGAKSAGTAATAVSAPAGLVVGDLEIMVGSTTSGATLSITTAGGGAWTLIDTDDPGVATTGEAIYAWYRINATGDSDPTITPSADHVCAARLAYVKRTFSSGDGITRPSPCNSQEHSIETTSDTSFSTLGVNGVDRNESVILCCASSGVDSNTAQVPVCTNADLTNLNSRASYQTTSGGGGGFGITEGSRAIKKAVLAAFACTYAGASPKAYVNVQINAEPPRRNPAADFGNLAFRMEALGARWEQARGRIWLPNFGGAAA